MSFNFAAILRETAAATPMHSPTAQPGAVIDAYKGTVIAVVPIMLHAFAELHVSSANARRRSR